MSQNETNANANSSGSSSGARSGHSSRRTRMILLDIIIFIAAVFILRGRVGSNSIKVSIGQESLTLSTTSSDEENADSTRMTISFDDIRTISLKEDLDIGVCYSGTDENRLKFGVFDNDEFGTYHLAATKTPSNYIVIQTDSDGFYVFNYESTDATESLEGALIDLLNEKGYTLETAE